MSSIYRVNYQLRPHRRDNFIEFIKALMLTTFALRKQNATEEYAEIMKTVEEIIEDHRTYQADGNRKKSRLYQMVPTVGLFFTPLPLQQAFVEYDSKFSVSKRKHVPPSFNDIRHILNIAQVHAIASMIELITFDGDQTLYADGDDFSKDSHLLNLILGLLKNGLTVAIVTAAGYPKNAARYEQRLSGLLHGFIEYKLSEEEMGRFYVLGGECNYLFSCNKDAKLQVVPDEQFYTKEMKSWTNDKINEIIEVSSQILESSSKEMNLKTKIITKERAVGMIRETEDVVIHREELDECALRVQQELLQRTNNVPFCAFNGGSDVWVDVGNKLIGVEVLQAYLNFKPEATLHVGDQFLSTGNDFLTRSASCTAWISSPKETGELLEILLKDLEKK